jgi:DNA polymerase-3 subunit alpha
MSEKKEEQFAIRFGLGAIKAVGFAVMENAVKERAENGEFKDIYDFSSRLDPKSINKKSVEALAKAGAFDRLNANRRQIAESFEILSNYANQKHEESSSNQMNLFGSISDSKPSLPKVDKLEKSGKTTKRI